LRRNIRIVVTAFYVLVACAAALTAPRFGERSEFPSPSPLPGTTLVASDDFEGPLGRGFAWRMFESDPGLKVVQSGDVLRVGGRIGRIERSPSGLATARMPSGDFDVRVRVRLLRCSGTGSKEAFLEVRPRDGDALMLYMSPAEAACPGGEPWGEDELAPEAKTVARFTAWWRDATSGSSVESKDGPRLAAVHRRSTLLRITYEAALRRVRAFVDHELVGSFTKELDEPTFAIGVQGVDEGSRIEVAFDDFMLYRRN
jgi:hypothetical protein